MLRIKTAKRVNQSQLYAKIIVLKAAKEKDSHSPKILTQRLLISEKGTKGTVTMERSDHLNQVTKLNTTKNGTKRRGMSLAMLHLKTMHHP